MKLPLSKRLRACCGLVRPGDRIADIGCDHGYLSIELVMKGVARSAIASDINQGPLDSARENAAKYGVSDRISFHLTDGAEGLPRDFDTLVCAGMGGPTMISILEAAPWLKNSRYRLILQCQSNAYLLRQYLTDNGWYIQRENLVRDGRFLYTVMEVLYGPGLPLTPGQCFFPDALLGNEEGNLVRYYRWVLKGLGVKVSGRGEDCDPLLKSAWAELASLPEDPRFCFLKEAEL